MAHYRVLLNYWLLVDSRIGGYHLNGVMTAEPSRLQRIVPTHKHTKGPCLTLFVIQQSEEI